jgi:hypothetical protein
MKKGFGVFFIIIGILNFIIGVLGLSTEYKSQAFPKILFGLAVLPLGIWMYNSSKVKEVEADYEYRPHPLKTKKKKLKKKHKAIKSEYPIKKKTTTATTATNISTANTKFLIAIINPFREIFDTIAKKRNLKTPKHFDLIIDSFLVSQFLYYAPKIYDFDFFDQQTQKEVINYIYDKNIDKIKNTNLTTSIISETYSFGMFYEDFFIESIINDYSKIAKNELFAKELIRSTIHSSLVEMAKVRKSYAEFNGTTVKLKTAVEFFINCFVHPISLTNRDYVIHDHKHEIDELCEGMYTELLKDIPDCINLCLSQIKEM